MSGFFYTVGESLLGDDKYNITTGDKTYITSFGIVSVLVLDIRLVTPQISTGCPGNVIYKCIKCSYSVYIQCLGCLETLAHNETDFYRRLQ